MTVCLQVAIVGDDVHTVVLLVVLASRMRGLSLSGVLQRMCMQCHEVLADIVTPVKARCACIGC